MTGLLILLLATLQDKPGNLKEAVRTYNPDWATRIIQGALHRNSRGSVEALIAGLGETHREMETIRRMLVKAGRNERAIKRDYRRADPNVRPELLATLKRLGSDIQTLERRLAALQDIRNDIVRAFSRLSGTKAVATMLDRLQRSGDWHLRVALARALAENPHIPFEQVTPVLLQRLGREQSPDVTIELIDALRLRRDKRQAVVDLLNRRLASDPPRVVSATIDFLVELGAPESVDPLIRSMTAIEGRVRHEIQEVLTRLTGTERSADPQGWTSWWEEHGEAFMAGRYVPPEGDSPNQAVYTDFFGIPVLSNRVLFVLDRSDSMGEAVQWRLSPEDRKLKEELGVTGRTKFDAVRFQLKKGLARMVRGSRFNIILVGDRIEVFNERVVMLDDGIRREAFEFLDRIEAGGGTNLYSGLELARGFITGPDEKTLSDGIDTLYLFSDGLASAGEVRQAEGLRRRLADVSRTCRVRIHTVYAGIEEGEGRDLMMRVAADSGGVFVVAGR